ncbi:hypothetical protein E6W36_15280 [Hankyongella ginsenosidimutans]|uniref:Sel1 repeat family protein n=1 Tax=Hankyongella ginsenosidimutans TaxID=1763828 RepID=A0A4D7C5I3_9SPHN|nr:tetratricopeptide repeat protein [Hankyongella ginsenosidimutans]QCI80381.1 hypothetical protein E6W36_15280 [Hankyongella ginsenosidimutans]
MVSPGLENDPAALYNLGQMHRLGKGVPANDRQAVGYYERAAKLGHAGAQANLGTLLYFAPAPLGDITAAIGWWREAAKVNEPHALYMLSVLMFNGELVARDWPRAYAYARLAASLGVNEAAAAVATMTKTLGAEDRQSSDALLVALSAPPASPQPNPASSAPVRVAAAQPVKVAAKPSPAPQSAPAVAPDAASTPDAPWRVQLGLTARRRKRRTPGPSSCASAWRLPAASPCSSKPARSCGSILALARRPRPATCARKSAARASIALWCRAALHPPDSPNPRLPAVCEIPLRIDS